MSGGATKGGTIKPGTCKKEGCEARLVGCAQDMVSQFGHGETILATNYGMEEVCAEGHLTLWLRIVFNEPHSVLDSPQVHYDCDLEEWLRENGDRQPFVI